MNNPFYHEDFAATSPREFQVPSLVLHKYCASHQQVSGVTNNFLEKTTVARPSSYRPDHLFIIASSILVLSMNGSGHGMLDRESENPRHRDRVINGFELKVAIPALLYLFHMNHCLLCASLPSVPLRKRFCTIFCQTASALISKMHQCTEQTQVFRAIPRSVLNKDPKVKKAANSAVAKAQRQRIPKSPDKTGRQTKTKVGQPRVTGSKSPTTEAAAAAETKGQGEGEENVAFQSQPFAV